MLPESTVEVLKVAVFARTSYPVERQAYTLGGKPVKEGERTLRHYGICDKSTLHQVDHSSALGGGKRARASSSGAKPRGDSDRTKDIRTQQVLGGRWGCISKLAWKLTRHFVPRLRR